jgi:hypothetical protein
MLVSVFLYYDRKDETDEISRDLYRQGVSAFGSKAPTYHVSLCDDKPKIVWDFHSLLLSTGHVWVCITGRKSPCAAVQALQFGVYRKA